MQKATAKELLNNLFHVLKTCLDFVSLLNPWQEKKRRLNTTMSLQLPTEASNKKKLTM